MQNTYAKHLLSYAKHLAGDCLMQNTYAKHLLSYAKHLAGDCLMQNTYAKHLLSYAKHLAGDCLKYTLSSEKASVFESGFMTISKTFEKLPKLSVWFRSKATRSRTSLIFSIQ
jgi:hypothetical protein